MSEQQPKQPQISIKGETLERLRRAIGDEAIGPMVDRLITDYLDEHAPAESTPKAESLGG